MPHYSYGLVVEGSFDDEDVLITKLRALHEHYLDYDPLLQMARAVRERIDWERVREETRRSPYARAFFTLIEGLELVEGRAAGSAETRPRIRLAE